MAFGQYKDMNASEFDRFRNFSKKEKKKEISKAKKDLNKFKNLVMLENKKRPKDAKITIVYE